MYKVFIGVGHGGNDPGAVSNGMKEADINLVMALTMNEELLRHGVIVQLSRTKNENDTLSDEIKEANIFKPDIAIDCHNNAGGGDGAEIYRQTNRYVQSSTKLAELMETEIIIIGQNSRGIKTRLNSDNNDYYGFLRQVNCPSVIVEGVFVDNKTDMNVANTIEKQKKFGVAYAKAVLKYFKIDYKEPVSYLYKVQLSFYDQDKALSALNKITLSGLTGAYITKEEIK